MSRLPLRVSFDNPTQPHDPYGMTLDELNRELAHLQRIGMYGDDIQPTPITKGKIERRMTNLELEIANRNGTL